MRDYKFNYAKLLIIHSAQMARHNGNRPLPRLRITGGFRLSCEASTGRFIESNST